MKAGRLNILVALGFAAAILLSPALIADRELSQTVSFLLIAMWWVSFSFVLAPDKARAELVCLRSWVVRRLGSSRG